MDKILVIGALGQIGSELTMKLGDLYGNDHVIASDLKDPKPEEWRYKGSFENIDVRDKNSVVQLIRKYHINIIVDLAAILSANGEKNPGLAWDVNINGFINVLEAARELDLKQVLIPSSIAVFGPETPNDCAPQETVLRPTTMYGITKVAGELLGDYYVRKYNLDVRGLRYPGIISHETQPGGGTTDYAVEIFFDAVKKGKYTCFVSEDTRLPMMYMPDCLKATIDLMQADFSRLRHHCDFNVGSMSFTVKELADSIRRRIPDFKIEYKPDHRQAIADSWPSAVDDSVAREEWGWRPDYDLESMTDDMLNAIRDKE
jgi:nucleoside-diphosphate-sugar epimerase